MSGGDVVRVLQVTSALDVGGIETWLLEVLRHIDRERFKVDILTGATQKCRLDDAVEALGCRVIRLRGLRRPWSYIRRFERIAREYGPYDAIHAHIAYTSGFIMRLGESVGIPTRIVHSHNAYNPIRASLSRTPYRRVMCYWMHRHATHLLAVSQEAVPGLFGADHVSDPRCRIVTPGIDLDPFRAPVDRAALRNALGIPVEATVVGHVGRFAPAKNHRFLLEVASAVLRRRPEVWFLLVGDGDLRPAVEARAREMGLADRCVFAGIRSDVPELMMGAMDVFLLPSLYEGLPRVVLEAQAAALPSVVSYAIAEEAVVAGPLVTRLSLDESHTAWADAVLAVEERRAVTNQADTLAAMAQSPFNVVQVVRELEKLYTSARTADRERARPAQTKGDGA